MGSDFNGPSKIEQGTADSLYANNPRAAAQNQQAQQQAPYNAMAYNQGSSGFRAPGVGTFQGLSSVNPYEDPAFGQYMRSLGVNQGNLQAEVALRQNQLGNQQAQQAPVFAEQLANGMRNIGNDSESRGTFNSGRRIQDQTQFSGDVARSQLQYNTGVADQQAQLQQQLASGIATMNQGAAEQQLAARQNVALTNAQAGLYQ